MTATEKHIYKFMKLAERKESESNMVLPRFLDMYHGRIICSWQGIMVIRHLRWYYHGFMTWLDMHDGNTMFF